MQLLILYCIALIIGFLSRRGKSVFRDSLFIVYTISAICGLMLMLVEGGKESIGAGYSYIPLIYLYIIVIIWIVPYRNLGDFHGSRLLDEGDINSIKKISDIVIILFLPFTLLLAYNAISVFQVADISYYRLEGDYYSYFVGGSFFSAGVYLSMLFFVPQILFFLSYRYHYEGIKRVLLLLCSFSFTFMTLCFAGRDGIAYWIMNSIVLYYYFKDSYDYKARRSVKRVFYIVGGFAFVVFLFITFFRFVVSHGNTDSKGIILPLLNYLGQSVHVFSQTLNLTLDQIRNLENTDKLSYTFGTFVKSLITRYGYLGSIIVSVIQVFVVSFFIKVYNKYRRIWDFFIVFLLFQIPYYGVFYYRQGIQSMELVYLFSFVLFIFLNLFYGKNSRI